MSETTTPNGHEFDGAAATPPGAADPIDLVRARCLALLGDRLAPGDALSAPRRQLALEIGNTVAEVLESEKLRLDLRRQRDLVGDLLSSIVEQARHAPAQPTRENAAPDDTPSSIDGESGGVQGKSPAKSADVLHLPDAVASSEHNPAQTRIDTAKARIHPILMDRIDIAAAAKLERDEIEHQIAEMVAEILGEEKLQLNRTEQKAVVDLLVNDMLGLGPLEPLLADETVTDIMVNGPKQIYVERGGKLTLTDITFRDNAHVMNVATRIVTRIGRRIDESSPLVDARLEDGSRVNIIAPPLAIDGASISIRKFSKKKITLDIMARQNNLSEPLAMLLKIASRCRLNILISGGTGSGKTTLLNAMSRMIDHGERILTIEDAAELQLQQPHVVRLETRPPSLEGQGEITMRDLVKNALRMRPDRIILGEVRGAEAIDMLQAMNTGHDGSMCTLHANSPREALTRLENMVAMSGVKLPARAVRTQIADAINMVVQISRMRDGMRRVIRVTEIVGMEGDIITTQDLFRFDYAGEDESGRLKGSFEPSGLRPNFIDRAEYFGLGNALLEVMGCSANTAP